MTVYLASPVPLPLVEWDEREPAFYVSLIREPEEIVVQRQFQFEHSYYLGSHEGCGCGFSYNQVAETPEDRKEEQAAAESIARLAKYLEEALVTASALELFACWSGDQQQQPGSRLQMVPSEITVGTFAEVEPPLFFTFR